MRFKTNLFLMVFAALLLVGTQGFSQKKDACQGKQKMSRMDRLENAIPDLTDQQKKDIEKIGLDTKKQSLPITNELREKRAHLKTLQSTDPIDQVAIDKEIDAIGKLRTELTKLREDARIKIRNVLTDDQKVVFDTKVQEHKGGRKANCGHNCKH